MEYIIRLGDTPADLAAIEQQLLEIDPAALIDHDPATATLRCSTCALEVELLPALARAGQRLAPTAIELQPSVCCGGCSG